MEVARRCHETELRFVDAQAGAPAVGTLTGYAAVYGSMSKEIGPPSRRFRERIMPGAFRSALATAENVFAYYDHGLAGGEPGSAMPLGSTLDGSLRLHEDAHGFGFELDLPDTQNGRDLAVLSKRGTVRGVSFAFTQMRDSWHLDAGQRVRTVHEVVGLRDVSPTHRPAYPDTTLAIRSLDAWEAGGARSLSADGEVSWEQKSDAIRAALHRLLGDRWDSDGWEVVATFAASVVVRRRGRYEGRFELYPLTWTGAAVALGAPSLVDEIYQSKAPGLVTGAVGETEARRLRTRLAEISLTAGSGGR